MLFRHAVAAGGIKEDDVLLAAVDEDQVVRVAFAAATQFHAVGKNQDGVLLSPHDGQGVPPFILRGQLGVELRQLERGHELDELVHDAYLEMHRLVALKAGEQIADVAPFDAVVFDVAEHLAVHLFERVFLNLPCLLHDVGQLQA